ncbi:MAG: hypothetical protein ACI4ST_00150, partial [Candidatus Gallimonas sp.]
MKNLSVRWQKLVVWLTGYLSIIAFVIAGGYIHQKTEQEEVRRSAKLALFVTAIFTALDLLRYFLQCCVNLADASSMWIYDMSSVFSILKIVAFIVLFIVDITVGFGHGKQS